MKGSLVLEQYFSHLLVLGLLQCGQLII